MDYQALQKILHDLQPGMVEALKELVEYESPSTDKASLDRLSDRLAERFNAIGVEVQKHTRQKCGNHLEMSWGQSNDKSAKPVMILGHFDTVWPLGTLAERPFRIQHTLAFGPGSFDMKASIVLCEFALRAMAESGLATPRLVRLLFTSDEEVGSDSSRALVEEMAREASHVLVLEPSLPGGALKTARKGVGHYTIEAIGRAAHAGLDPGKGINAIAEIASIIVYLNGLVDEAEGTTINVGVIQGGSRSNVVPAHAQIEVDVRVMNAAETLRIEQAVAQLKPINPGATLKISGGFNRPPMERTEAVRALFERSRQIGRKLGMELEEGMAGGGSDGNFTAAVGTPTLDGLGAIGDGAHAENEHVRLDLLASRAALIAALLLEL